MARKRMIDPSFWEDEKLGTLEPTARLLFMGLISQADDEGRLKGHPSLLRSLIFPYDDSITIGQIETWLSMLADNERHLIFRYEVDNQKYIWIRNFKKHQTINKPQISKLPMHSDNYGIDTVEVQEQYGTVTAQKKGREEKEKGREVEEKGKEESLSPSDILNNPNEAHVTRLLQEHEVTMDNPLKTNQFFSYIGVVDIELMEAAILKCKGKKIAYCLGTLEGFISDGVTKESLLPKQQNSNVRSFPNRGYGTSKPQIPVAKPSTGTTLPPEERERIRQTARELDGMFNATGGIP